MKESSVRVLVVDDFERWRRFVRTTLQANLGVQIFEEAADGHEAVEKAQDLQPDLVVLDIGLPRLNGIEAARRIRSVSPKSKVVFLTENRSADVAEAVLREGACAYVVKSDGANELLNGIRTVLDGKRFVSASLGSKNLITDPKPEPICYHRHLEPLPEAHGKATYRHEVNFFGDDSTFVDGFAGFIGSILRSGSPVVVLTTESHRASIVRKLSQEGLDVGAAVEGKLFTVLNAVDSVAKFRLAEHLTEEAVRAAQGNLRVGVG